MTEEEVFSEFLAAAQTELKQYLQMNDRNATGRTSNSIQVKDVTSTGGKLVGNSNVFYTFLGRPDGAMPPLSAIADWCSSRNIPRSAAWPIAKKIKDAGTALFRELKSSGFQNNAISLAARKELVDQMLSKIANIYRTRLTTDMRSEIAKINQ